MCLCVSVSVCLPAYLPVSSPYVCVCLSNYPTPSVFLSRRTAETLLLRDGDFLVRESHGAPGQFVLTGLQNGVKKHLLLVDPEGVVSSSLSPPGVPKKTHFATGC